MTKIEESKPSKDAVCICKLEDNVMLPLFWDNEHKMFYFMEQGEPTELPSAPVTEWRYLMRE